MYLEIIFSVKCGVYSYSIKSSVEIEAPGEVLHPGVGVYSGKKRARHLCSEVFLRLINVSARLSVYHTLSE